MPHLQFWIRHTTQLQRSAQSTRRQVLSCTQSSCTLGPTRIARSLAVSPGTSGAVGATGFAFAVAGARLSCAAAPTQSRSGKSQERRMLLWQIVAFISRSELRRAGVRTAAGLLTCRLLGRQTQGAGSRRCPLCSCCCWRRCRCFLGLLCFSLLLLLRFQFSLLQQVGGEMTRLG